MTDPINTLSLRAWQDSTDPIEKFGVWFIRNGRYWKFNIVSQSFVTASDIEKRALDAERAKGTAPGDAPEQGGTVQGLTWDHMRWMP